MKSIKKQGTHIAAISAACLIALAGIAPAMAQEATPPVTATPAATATASIESRQGVFGTVTAKTDTSITIQKKDGTAVQLAIDANTQSKSRGEALTLADLAVGSRVAVQATGTGALTALRVMPIPSEPKREHRVLTVTSIVGKTLTAQDAAGNVITVELPHELSADIQGQLVTFIGEQSAQSSKFKANVEVKILQVVKRLEEHAKKADAEAKTTVAAEAKVKKEHQAADLKARLEANMQRHIDLFNEIIARAPEQAKPALKAALEHHIAGYKIALESIGESKGSAAAKLDLRGASGTVSAVAATANELTVQTNGETALTLKLTGDTRITIGDKPGTLADIAVSDRIEARYDEANNTAMQIRVIKAGAVKTDVRTAVRGTVKSVASGSVVVTTEDGREVTLTINDATRIQVQGVLFGALAINQGMKLEATYDPATGVASSIAIHAAAKGTLGK